MPRLEKSKCHARKKCHQTEGETQDLQSAQATVGETEDLQSAQATVGETEDLQSAQATVEEEKSSPSLAPTCVEDTPSKRASNRTSVLPKLSQSIHSTTKPKSAHPTRSYARASGNIKKKQCSLPASSSTVKPCRSLTGSIRAVVQFMMRMHKMKRPILKADMLKTIDKSDRKHFLEILGRASFSIEVVFGVDLKEMDPVKHSYILVNKMNLPNNGTLSRGTGFPKTGLLMNLLGVILLKGNCATEEMIWEFLNKMKIYDGKRHFVFGEPRKLITQDLVKLKYLEYRQVPGSHPARYEFLWGPRSHAETSKMKILEFWAKINHIAPSAFQSLYDEALKDEEERATAVAPIGDTLIDSQ